MTTQFRTLFMLNVSHAYYGTGCRDFDFVFPTTTTRLLGSRKLLARVRDGKLYVLFEADKTGAPLISAAGAKLPVGLRLLNPFFSNFTQLDFDFNSGIPYYRNAASPGVLDAPKTTRLAGRLLSHSLTDSARPLTVTLKDADGRALQTETITAANNRSTVSYDLTGQAPGAYAVESVSAADTTAALYYSDVELQQLGVFGVVEIDVDASFHSTPANFQIAFSAKEQTLKYYVVAKSYNDTEFNQVSVADAGFTEDARPQVTFAKVLPAAFTSAEIPPALLGDDKAKLALFKSEAVVARREKARKKIQLKKNGDVLVEHLPQPGASQVNSEMIIQISKP